MSVKVKFCGAAGTVTGSCYWIKSEKYQFLVDCGLFQGTKTIKELNYRQFPFDPQKIDFILLTHAHIDHAGLIPKLINSGFHGPIYTTVATRDLLSYMLPDSGYIQEIEVRHLNRRNRQRGRKSVKPIYTKRDAENALHQIRTVPYEAWLHPHAEVKVRFWNAGHILGSASIEIEINEPDHTEKLRVLFSGDLGPENKLFHPEPDAPRNYDYLFCETTYGGRVREDLTIAQRRQVLMKEINDAMQAGGALVIPSFAVERTQELLLDIAYLINENMISCSTVFLDSPLAIKVTSTFDEHVKDLEDLPALGTPFNHPGFKFTETVEESKSISRFKSGVIILAASGMCDAGRIRHHLKAHLWNNKSTILLVGYQAEGTLGRLLEQGVKSVNIQGEAIKVSARIRKIDIYSGHADESEIIEWIKARQPITKAIFLTHGSSIALQAMSEQLQKQNFPKKQVIIPELDDEYDISSPENLKRLTNINKRIAPELLNKLDWHNDLAKLLIDIRSSLEQTESDQEKTELINKIRDTFKKK